jgi:hypothetical protein
VGASSNQSGSSGGGWLLGGVCVVIIVIAAATNQGKSSPQQDSVSPATVAAEDASPQVAPPAPAALSPEEVRTGLRHFASTKEAGGVQGMMIYSQNCHEALGRDFSWAKLDRCGAFDQRASIELADEVGTEATYFEEETVAGRYLQAALKAGEPAEEADQRLAMLQAKITKARDAEIKAAALAAATVSDDEEGDTTSLEVIQPEAPSDPPTEPADATSSDA